jgi:hypothetical protein
LCDFDLQKEIVNEVTYIMANLSRKLRREGHVLQFPIVGRSHRQILERRPDNHADSGRNYKITTTGAARQGSGFFCGPREHAISMPVVCLRTQAKF